MKMNKRKKIVIGIVVLLVVAVFLIPRIVRSVRYLKKVAYIAALLTGERAEEEIRVDELIEAFVDKRNPPIYRKYAAEKLGHAIKDPSAVEPLIGVLQDKTENELIRKEAAFTLGLIGDPTAIDALVEALNDETLDNEPIRRKVIKALTMIEDDRIVAPLLEIVRDGNPAEKRVAALGLRVDRPEIVRVLVDLIKNEPEARYTATKSLGETRTKDEEAFQVLLDVLNGEYMDESYDSGDRGLLRGTAILALGKIGDKRAVEPLLKILEEDKSIRYIDAAIALGNLGDRRALEPLRKRMEEKKHKEWVMKDLNEAYRKLTQKSEGDQL